MRDSDKCLLEGTEWISIVECRCGIHKCGLFPLCVKSIRNCRRRGWGFMLCFWLLGLWSDLCCFLFLGKKSCFRFMPLKKWLWFLFVYVNPRKSLKGLKSHFRDWDHDKKTATLTGAEPLLGLNFSSDSEVSFLTTV
jgi:hypothetical protein